MRGVQYPVIWCGPENPKVPSRLFDFFHNDFDSSFDFYFYSYIFERLISVLHSYCNAVVSIAMPLFLGRMGNASRALSLITEHETDVSKAVDFCKEQNDDALWDELIDKSIHKPGVFSALLFLVIDRLYRQARLFDNSLLLSKSGPESKLVVRNFSRFGHNLMWWLVAGWGGSHYFVHWPVRDSGCQLMTWLILGVDMQLVFTQIMIVCCSLQNETTP